MESEQAPGATIKPSGSDITFIPEEPVQPTPTRRDLHSLRRWRPTFSPADSLLAISESCAAVPLVGKPVESLASLTAMALWGYRVAPEMVAYAVRGTLPSGEPKPRKEDLRPAHEISVEALKGLVSAERLNIDWPAPDRQPPVIRYANKRRQYLHRSLSYGGASGQVLDVWRRKNLPTEPAPVLVFVPGGGWVQGSRRIQGYALMSHLAEQGWICLSIDYGASPRHRWPRHITDVMAAVAWARGNVAEFGGNPDFVAAAGCSAGGHLAALAGLTFDDPGFHVEPTSDADTALDAVVSIYGRYDWVDRSTPERDRFVEFLERVVVKERLAQHPNVFRDASPIARVRPDAPPFLVVHGGSDTVIPVAQAREFVDRLRETSRSTVGYLEVPGAQHGFDLTDGARTASVITAIGLFLNETHERAIASRSGLHRKTAEMF